MSEFYGRGLAFPLQLGVAGLAQAAGGERVRQAIRMILGTRPGERVMRPDFGSHLTSLAFAPNNGETANLARYYVADALDRWEPRIEVVDVVVTNDNVGGRLLIEVSYRLRATQDVQNLVHAFPLEPTP
jgi:phage baseplate assembly protein W